MNDSGDTPDQAENADTLVKPKSCLQCSKRFQPAHKHNWMCRKCKNKNRCSDWDTWGGKVMYDAD